LSSIYSDLSARLEKVHEGDSTVITDGAAIEQSIIRLTTTQEGSFPNYRGYGLDIKKYLHYPMTNETALEIFEDIRDKVAEYETRGEVLGASSTVTLDHNTSSVTIDLAIEVKRTGEILYIPTIGIPVGG
jgi:phage baseplate assembly protein W